MELVICFKSVIDPFEFAINLLKGISTYNISTEDLSDAEKIQIRIGISSGETLPVRHFDKRSLHAAPWGRDMVMAKRDHGYWLSRTHTSKWRDKRTSYAV
jgi:hypothetical protein